MRSDRPLIASIVFLATGLSLIFGYCNGATSFDAAFPLASSALHLDVVTTGPAALGGLACTGIGLIFMLWALLAAIVSQLGGMATHSRDSREPNRVVPSDRVLE